MTAQEALSCNVTYMLGESTSPYGMVIGEEEETTEKRDTENAGQEVPKGCSLPLGWDCFLKMSDWLCPLHVLKNVVQTPALGEPSSSCTHHLPGH